GSRLTAGAVLRTGGGCCQDAASRGASPGGGCTASAGNSGMICGPGGGGGSGTAAGNAGGAASASRIGTRSPTEPPQETFRPGGVRLPSLGVAGVGGGTASLASF